jgi:hypothetical protein
MGGVTRSSCHGKDVARQFLITLGNAGRLRVLPGSRQHIRPILCRDLGLRHSAADSNAK